MVVATVPRENDQTHFKELMAQQPTTSKKQQDAAAPSDGNNQQNASEIASSTNWQDALSNEVLTSSDSGPQPLRAPFEPQDRVGEPSLARLNDHSMPQQLQLQQQQQPQQQLARDGLHDDNQNQNQHHQRLERHEENGPSATKRPKLWLRTREKERFKLQNLQLDVMQLRQEIHRLQTLQQMANCRLLMSQQAEKNSLVLLVQTYFNRFRHGVQIPSKRKTPIPTTTNTSACGRAGVGGSEWANQELFLRRVMDAKVHLGRFQGVEIALEQWRRYCEFLDFGDSRLISVHFVDAQGSPIIRSQADFEVKLTRRSVRELFPHVLENKSMTKKLVGLRLTIQTGVLFYFNPRGKIIRLEVGMSFFEAFAKVFRDPKELLALLGQAHISPESFLGKLPEHGRRDQGDAEEKAPTRDMNSTTTGQMHLAHILS